MPTEGTMDFRHLTKCLVLLLATAAYLASADNANLGDAKRLEGNSSVNGTPTDSETTTTRIDNANEANKTDETPNDSETTAKFIAKAFELKGTDEETSTKDSETETTKTDRGISSPVEELKKNETDGTKNNLEATAKLNARASERNGTEEETSTIVNETGTTESGRGISSPEEEPKQNETEVSSPREEKEDSETEAATSTEDYLFGNESYTEPNVHNETEDGSGYENDTASQSDATEVTEETTVTMSSTTVTTTRETTTVTSAVPSTTSVPVCPRIELTVSSDTHKISLNWSLHYNHSALEHHDFVFHVRQDGHSIMRQTHLKAKEITNVRSGDEHVFCVELEKDEIECVKQAQVCETGTLTPKEPNHGTGLTIAFAVLVIAVLIAVIAIKSKRRIMNYFYGRMRNRSATAIIMDKLPSSVRPSQRLVPYKRPIPISKLDLHFRMMSADSKLKFSVEFEELNANSPVCPYTAALLPENQTKNRWTNILPFDHSRVKLLPIADDLSSDYINANYIPGYTSQREYIATQGPLPHTVDDFWRMIWEQGSSVIVMLTQCVERGRLKCEEYWPSDHEFQYYGDLAICLKSETTLPEYTIRIFDIQLGSRIMEVKQIHFTMWPDFGCPENTQILLDFVKSVRTHVPYPHKGPIVVHCSAGVGRTGTFIAVERLMKHVHEFEEADVFSLVRDMRRYRNFMVQTEDQYVYIHECLRDYLMSVNEAPSEISATESQLFLNKSDL